MRDDIVLTPRKRELLLSSPVVIEEKLDGANLSVAMAPGGAIAVAARGGADTMDRGGHLGRARGWLSERSDGLRKLLAGGRVLYGEWLLTRHRIEYEALPDFFVGFDLLDPERGWISTGERGALFVEAGILLPPLVAEVDATSLDTLDMLAGPSAFGAPRMEGLIIRAVEPRGGSPRIAKRLAPGLPSLEASAFGSMRNDNKLARASGEKEIA